MKDRKVETFESALTLLQISYLKRRKIYATKRSERREHLELTYKSLSATALWDAKKVTLLSLVASTFFIEIGLVLSKKREENDQLEMLEGAKLIRAGAATIALAGAAIVANWEGSENCLLGGRRTLDCCRVKQGKSVLVFGHPVLPMGRKGAFFTPGGNGSLYSSLPELEEQEQVSPFFWGAEQSKNETDQMIVLEWLFLTIAPCDAAEPWKLGSQDAATPMMQGIIDLHHDIFFFLILILTRINPGGGTAWKQKCRRSVIETSRVAGDVSGGVSGLFILDEYAMFSMKSYTFKDLTSMSQMATMEPKNWWVNFGAQTRFLQALAFRLLGQPSSSSCVERNWSTYAFIYSLRRNKLTTSNAQDLVYIHNNLRIFSRNPNGDVKMWDVGGDAFDSMENAWSDKVLEVQSRVSKAVVEAIADVEEIASMEVERDRKTGHVNDLYICPGHAVWSLKTNDHHDYRWAWSILVHCCMLEADMNGNWK
ncbi:hypothetical protein E3N88_29637 [Mikania micrantha]|uniref:HAT C-terminal dimerisation domain-containing protein n=1 Tax=Mikania micrantha TaxID=192012 RepID=A0A5N6MM95_9ASTR|nr:hypothetical protein E3N88_29637 [Mikania micrantha]